MNASSASPWFRFLSDLQDAGGSTDMQTSKTGRYPWLFHFCRGQADTLKDVVVYAHCRQGGKALVLSSPPRDWSTEALLKADYRALKDHGGQFNDTGDALGAEVQS